LDWNKVELANSDIFNGREDFTQDQLQVIMEKALKLNNPSFVLLLIENNFQIEKFSTYKRFYDAKNGLYNFKIKVIILKFCMYILVNKNNKFFIKILSKDLKEAPFRSFIRNKQTDTFQNADKNDSIIDSNEVKNFIEKKILKGITTKNLFPDQHTHQQDIDPIMNLFIWCILYNRIEIAKIILPMAKVCVLF